MIDEFLNRLPEPLPTAEVASSVWLTAATNALAGWPGHAREEFAELCKKRKAEIRMCLAPAPASVVVAWLGPDDRPMEFRFSAKHTPMEDISPPKGIVARGRRLTSFPFTILVVAAELVADTWRRRAADLPFPPSGSNPESENTPSLPQPGVSTRTNQPRELHAAGHYHIPETKRVCANYQAHGSRGPFPTSKEPRRHEARP